MMFTPVLFTNDIFDDFFDDMFTPVMPRMVNRNSNLMNTDIKDEKDHYEMDIELPGFNKEDISADLKDGYLIIHAQHEDKNDDKYVRRERFSGQVERSFYVGDAVKKEDIKAAFKNGILQILVPKKEEKPAIDESHQILIA
jgi:HSP20 family protein